MIDQDVLNELTQFSKALICFDDSSSEEEIIESLAKVFLEIPLQEK